MTTSDRPTFNLAILITCVFIVAVLTVILYEYLKWKI